MIGTDMGKARSDTWLAEPEDREGTPSAIEAMLALLPTRNRWCVEFGAWDGNLASNSRALVLGGYSAVLIEADPSTFRQLEANYGTRADVHTIQAFVGFGDHDNLDTLLRGTPIPRDFDFLSVDIDGNDYHVWRAVVDYRPKLVCIEFNHTVPPEVSFVQPADPSIAQRSTSLTAMIELGKSKGYELICVAGVNAFFVAREYYAAYELSRNDIYALWPNREFVTYLFSGCDGTMFLRGYCQLPWYEVPLSERRIQHLPKFLRKFPYLKWQRRAYVAVTSPGHFLKRARNRLRQQLRRKT